jgi:chemotaxis protein methyltransferase CheR
VSESVVSPASFAFLARLLRDRSALVLEPGKEYLVKSRLAPLVQKHGLESIEQLINRLRAAGQNGLLTEVVEAMVTTETSFFRDVHPFETLKRTVLPQLIEQRRSQRQLKIWCAASASGQEPYSVAILLREYFPELADWRIQFWATDISHQMLQRCRTARYSQVEVNRGLPTPLLLKWFRQEGAVWQLDARIRDTVVFAPLNLAQPWPAMPMWDLIFLRNVLIYFDNETKKQILGRAARLLCRDGFLLLGGAETTLNLDDSYERIQTLRSGYYRLKPS